MGQPAPVETNVMPGSTPEVATEEVSRPPPGLARGRFAASEGFFYIVLAVTLVAILAYLFRRRWLRLLRRT